MKNIDNAKELELKELTDEELEGVAGGARFSVSYKCDTCGAVVDGHYERSEHTIKTGHNKFTAVRNM